MAWVWTPLVVLSCCCTEKSTCDIFAWQGRWQAALRLFGNSCYRPHKPWISECEVSPTSRELVAGLGGGAQRGGRERKERRGGAFRRLLRHDAQRSLKPASLRRWDRCPMSTPTLLPTYV